MNDADLAQLAHPSHTAIDTSDTRPSHTALMVVRSFGSFPNSERSNLTNADIFGAHCRAWVKGFEGLNPSKPFVNPYPSRR